MVQLKCDCDNRYETEINSYKFFEEIKTFFEEQVQKEIFEDVLVAKPFYTGYSVLQKKKIKWYATKWYKCRNCGCLWEFNHPDFPIKGFVRKFKDGNYFPKDTTV